MYGHLWRDTVMMYSWKIYHTLSGLQINGSLSLFKTNENHNGLLIIDVNSASCGQKSNKIWSRWFIWYRMVSVKPGAPLHIKYTLPFYCNGSLKHTWKKSPSYGPRLYATSCMNQIWLIFPHIKSFLDLPKAFFMPYNTSDDILWKIFLQPSKGEYL